jgi:Ca2+-binding EF-hand superfamily protein
MPIPVKKVLKIKLSTGHKIEVVPTDHKMLRHAYEYMAGFVKRHQLMGVINSKKAELKKIQGLLKPKGIGLGGTPPSPTATSDAGTGVAENLSDQNMEKKQTDNQIDDVGVDLRTAEELAMDKYYQAREELRVLEEKYANFKKQDHKISPTDMSDILKYLGAPQSEKAIDYMIWEVDEHGDHVVDWDEFQLTFYRNITNNNLTEACNFFNVMEFITFDPHITTAEHKGFIMEDDVMEILFSRYGGTRLEKELEFIFGSNLRSKGGDGTIQISDYLTAVQHRTGKRAVMAIV